jgi:hypothetical protein
VTAPAAWPAAEPATEPATGPAAVSGRGDHRRRHRRRLAVTGGAVVTVVALAAAGATAAGIGPLRSPAAAGAPASADSPASTSLATVTRQTLSERTQEDATVGYAGAYSVVNQAAGTLTALPAIGQIIDPGKVLYRVNGAPVLLLRGSVPAYRTLSKGMSGADVRQLNAALVALGKATSDELDPASDDFSSATVTALKKLQDALDVDQTGSLALGQAVFLPSAARITAVPVTLGTPAAPGVVVLEASSRARVVTITLDAAQQSEFANGNKVSITMADGRTTPGVVSSVSKVAAKPADNAAADTKPTVTVTIIPTRPAETGSKDEVTATVTITTRSVKDALTVPVNALLALAGGGYAVEVDAAGARHLVPVTLGLFDDSAGLVQVTGAGIKAGQRIVVPAS